MQREKGDDVESHRDNNLESGQARCLAQCQIPHSPILMQNKYMQVNKKPLQN